MRSAPRAGSPAQRLAGPELIWPGKARPIALPEGALNTTAIVGAERDGLAPVAGREGWSNRLIWGDNLPAMAALLPDCAGQIGLIYVDPPFNTGTSYVQTVSIPGSIRGRRPRVLREVAYRDAWGAGQASYLQMLYERLRLMYLLLADGGAIYVHVDPTVGPYVRLLLDEVFGPTGFQREIVWRIGWVSGYKSAVANWVRNHDTILYYSKGRPAVFNKEYLAHPAGYRRRGGGSRTDRGYPIEDVWNASPAEHALAGCDSLDSIQIKSFSTEKTGFPTQKNESILRRIIRASSNPADLVADFFCGSGTTLAVADQLGRGWIGCDASWRAIHTARKRLVGEASTRAFQVEHTAEAAGGLDQRACVIGPSAAAAPQLEFDVHVAQRTVEVSLRGYQPGASARARAGRSATEGVALLDYWAVDFAHDGTVFRDAWRSFRTRGHEALQFRSGPHTYSTGGTYQIAVTAADVYGQQTTAVRDVVLH